MSQSTVQTAASFNREVSQFGKSTSFDSQERVVLETCYFHGHSPNPNAFRVLPILATEFQKVHVTYACLS